MYMSSFGLNEDPAGDTYFTFWIFLFLPVAHSSAKTIQMKSSMTFIHRKGCTEIDLIFKKFCSGLYDDGSAFSLYAPISRMNFIDLICIGFAKLWGTGGAAKPFQNENKYLQRDLNKQPSAPQWKLTKGHRPLGHPTKILIFLIYYYITIMFVYHIVTSLLLLAVYKFLNVFPFDYTAVGISGNTGKVERS